MKGRAYNIRSSASHLPQPWHLDMTTIAGCSFPRTHLPTLPSINGFRHFILKHGHKDDGHLVVNKQEQWRWWGTNGDPWPKICGHGPWKQTLEGHDIPIYSYSNKALYHLRAMQDNKSCTQFEVFLHTYCITWFVQTAYHGEHSGPIVKRQCSLLLHSVATEQSSIYPTLHKVHVHLWTSCMYKLTCRKSWVPL